MAQWINDSLLRGDDGNIYQEVGDGQFVPFAGSLPSLETTQTEEVAQPVEEVEQGPETADVVKGLAAEATIATGGQALGTIVPPLYPIVAYTSGVIGSLTAQYIEGREDISWGRANIAGGVNTIPFSSAVKLAKGGKITADVVKGAIKTEAKRGAAIGAAEATAVAVIDENRLPTATELAQYGGVGALFGGAVGAVSPKLSKSFSKMLGKNAEEIDNSVVTGEIDSEDLINLKVTSSELEAQRILEETKETVTNRQVLKTLANATSADTQSAWERTKAWLAPSKITGREAQEITFYGRNELRANAELSSKIADRVDKFLKKNPAAIEDVNAYLNTSTPLPNSLKGTAIAGDLSTFRETITSFQRELTSQLSEHRFTNLSKKDQKALLGVIQESMLETNPNYLTREYRAFTDVEWKPDPKLKQAAIAEVADKIKAKNSKINDDEAIEQATNHINNIVKNSAKNRSLTEDVNFVGSADSVLKARSNPGKYERAFLGEIVDPAERIRGTLDNVGRLVYKNKSDIAMANTLKQVGLAVEKAPDDSAFVQLQLKGNLKTDLYVPNDVQFALDKTYLAGYQDRGADVLLEGVRDLYETGVGLSKATKVVLNPPSYAVNMWGGMTTLLGSGINPLSVKYLKGLKYSLAEYGSVDKLLAGNKEETRKAMTAAMKDMTKYGISNANVISSDIRSSFSRGFFSEKVNKALEPISKAYQATDTAARFAVWATNQDRLAKMFPGLAGDDLKLAAAKLTNDTYQNYDKLSNTIRVLSRTGIMPQFVSFTAEFMRNIYNQTRYATQMIRGNFGADLGIDVSNANLSAMRAEGIKRIIALSSVIAGTEAARQAYNAANGVDEEEEQALKETVVADFDKSKSLLFTRDEETGELSYANLSYIVPHAMIAEAFNAAMSDQPLDSLSGILADNFIGEGTFVAQSAIQSINNVDANGKPISDSPQRLQRFKDQMNYFVSEAFKPGVSREAEKLINTVTKDDPEYSFKELAQRQLGHRVNKVDIAENSMFKIREANKRAQRSASAYTSLLKYGNPTQSQLREEYQKAETLRRQNLEVVKEHYNNLVTLGLSEDERIKAMKDAGVSSKDIIAIIENTYIPLPTELKQDVKEVYDERYQGMSRQQIVRDISLRAKEDPALAKKLRSELKDRLRQERSNLSAKEVLLKNLSSRDRALYAIANPDDYEELVRKRIITKSVLLELRSTPEGKALLSRRR